MALTVKVLFMDQNIYIDLFCNFHATLALTSIFNNTAKAKFNMLIQSI